MINPIQNWYSQVIRISSAFLTKIDSETFEGSGAVILPNTGKRIALPNDFEERFKILNDSEKDICRIILKEFYSKFSIKKVELSNWKPLLKFLAENFQHAFPNTKYQTESEAPLYIVARVKHNIYKFYEKIEKERSKILREVIASEDFWREIDVLAITTSKEIRKNSILQIENKSKLQQIKYLTNLKKALGRSLEKYNTNAQLDIDLLNFENGYEDYSMREDLFNWIEEAYFKATPEIEFLSITQIKMLRMEVERISLRVQPIEHFWGFYNLKISSYDPLQIGYAPKLLMERFDKMIKLKSRVRRDVQSVKRDFRIKESLDNNPSSATIIRYLIYGLKGLNSNYSNEQLLSDLRIWISTLFYDIQGFSYDDIRKALERKRQLYN